MGDMANPLTATTARHRAPDEIVRRSVMVKMANCRHRHVSTCASNKVEKLHWETSADPA
jgi:hypothetical protein